MKIVDIVESTRPIGSDIRNAYMQTMDRLAGDLARLEGVEP